MVSCFTSLSHKLSNRLSKSRTMNWSNNLYKTLSFQQKDQEECAFSTFGIFFSICLIQSDWIKSFSLLLQWMLLKALRVPTTSEISVLEKAGLKQGKGHSSWSLSFSDASALLSRTAFIETALSTASSWTDGSLPSRRAGFLRNVFLLISSA